MTPFLISIYFFVWETTYSRAPPPPPPVLLQETTHTTTTDSMDDMKKSSVTQTESINSPSESGSVPQIPALGKYNPPTEGTPEDPKRTTGENLKIFRGRVTERSFFKALIAPFPFMIFPSVMFSTVVNGAFLTWGVMAMVISTQVLLYPPYNLQPDTLAYLGLPGSVVGLITAIISGTMSDKMIQWMAHRNNGVYEPEYRLLLMIPATICSTLALLLTGPLYRDYAAVWKLVMVGCLGSVATPFATGACITYIFDTMQGANTEAFVATSLFKLIFVFFATKYVPAWFQSQGPVKTFNTLAVLNLCFGLLTIPMYIFGKRLRGMVSYSRF
jgi:hypothetical protein